MVIKLQNMIDTWFDNCSEYFRSLIFNSIFIKNFQTELSALNSDSVQVGCNLNVRKRGSGVCECLWFGKHGGTPGSNTAVTAGFLFFFLFLRLRPYSTFHKERLSNKLYPTHPPPSPILPQIHFSRILKRVEMHEPTKN